MHQGLRIDEQTFNELYPDLAGKYHLFNNPVPSNITPEEFERRYLSSKLWRLNNVYKVINKDGEPVQFRMNYAQHVVYARTRQHSRVIILKSRQQGISTLWLVSYFDDAVFCPFLSIGLMAQGTDEASSLLERTKFLWDNLDSDVKAFAGVQLDKDNTKEYSFTNNSKIFIRVSFRSTTLQRLHVSEFGKIANQYPKRARETKTGTLQALARGNTGIIESTAEGRNMFKTLWDESVLAKESGQMTGKDFYPVFLPWWRDPDCVETVDQTIDRDAEEYFKQLENVTGVTLTRQQKNFWVTQRRELGGDIYQEYPATPEEAFTASRDGTYYNKLFNSLCVTKGRVMPNVYDPNLATDVYFDLGVDDYTVMLFVQWYRGEWRIIDEYMNNGYGLRHYLDFVKDTNYGIRALRFPHDIEVRELGSNHHTGLAKSRMDIVREYCTEENLDWQLDTLPRGSVEAGIESVRRIIPNLIVDTQCSYIIDCLLNYSKEWDDKLQVWKKTPRHDEYSHGADALRQLASNTIESESYNDSLLADQQMVPRNTGFAI